MNVIMVTNPSPNKHEKRQFFTEKMLKEETNYTKQRQKDVDLMVYCHIKKVILLMN